MTTTPIAIPTPSHVQEYLEKWRTQGTESSDAALRLLFKTMPANVDVGEVAVKVAALNATNIYGVVQMAHHIVELDIDDALAAEVADPQLVEKSSTSCGSATSAASASSMSSSTMWCAIWTTP